MTQAARDAGSPIDLGHLNNVGRRRLPLAVAVPQRLDGDVGADRLLAAETIGDRFRRVRHLQDHAFNPVLFHTGGERRAGRPDNAYGRAGDGRAMSRLFDESPRYSKVAAARVSAPITFTGCRKSLPPQDAAIGGP